MPIPDYQSIMLPLLQLLKGKQEFTTRNAIETLANTFQLTDDEKSELLASGQQSVFDNRVGWARTYLKKAGLLSNPQRGIIKITDRGLQTLAMNPSSISIAYLKQFPEFNDFLAIKNTNNNNGNAVLNPTNTPEEEIDAAYQQIRQSLASELLTKIMGLSPAFFEKLVVELLVKMGYGGSIQDAGKALGKSGDEGIDGIIKEDKLGLDVIYIQAKRWQQGSSVGRPEIQKFVGALAGQGAKKGIFITTASFSREAIEYIPRNETKIVLINGDQLTQLMIDYNLGVNNQKTYEIKRIDSDYFEE